MISINLHCCSMLYPYNIIYIYIYRETQSNHRNKTQTTHSYRYKISRDWMCKKGSFGVFSGATFSPCNSLRILPGGKRCGRRKPANRSAGFTKKLPVAQLECHHHLSSIPLTQCSCGPRCSMEGSMEPTRAQLGKESNGSKIICAWSPGCWGKSLVTAHSWLFSTTCVGEGRWSNISL